MIRSPQRSDAELAGPAAPQTQARQPAHAGTQVWLRLAPRWWLPPLLVALATILALSAAYSVRPATRVALGDYYDSIYLDNFHDREVGALSQGAAAAWPADQPVLELPGLRTGTWLVTIHAAEQQPNGALDQATLAVNEQRVNIARRGPRLLVAVIPAHLAASERLALRLVPLVEGATDTLTGLAGRVELAPARMYRWSREMSSVRLPALGQGAWSVSLAAVVAHPDGTPPEAAVLANGVPLARLPEYGATRRLQMLVPASLMQSGDLTLSINARPFHDPRPLGVLIQEVSVAPVGPGPLLPPPGSLLYALLIALGLYFCLNRMAGRRALAAMLALAVIGAGALALATARYPTAFMLPRLAGLAVWSAVLLLGLERLLPWLARLAGIELSRWLLRALLLTFFIGYWIKAGGMLYPYFVGIDVSWHMDRARMILGGQLPLLYGTNSPLNETTMPVNEWGVNRPVIPYSPWFHIFAASFALLPMPPVLTAHMFSALVDSSRVFLIALLGRKLGLGERESLLAALLYAVTPATFLLHSWGNIPTTFGMWWTLVSTVYIVAAYKRLDRPWPFVGLVLLLTATLLFYTVMAVFMLIFLGVLVPALWLATHQYAERRSVVALGLATATALGLATLIYYGQYIPPILERTVPYFLSGGPQQEGATIGKDPFGLYLAKYWPRMAYLRPGGAYGLQLTLLLGLLGLRFIREQRWRVLLGCWLAVALVFLVAGNKISMVDKHVFYSMPVFMLGAGLLLGRLWRRGKLARLIVVGLYVFTLAAALQMWIYRIATVRQ